MARRVLLVVALVALCNAAPTLARNAEPVVILVGFDDIAGRDAAHARVGGTVETSFEEIAVDVVRLPAGVDAATGIARYAALGGVAFAEPNHIGRGGAQPNDPYFEANSFDGRHLRLAGQNVVADGPNDVRWSLEKVSAPAAWAKLPMGSTFTIGVIDSGIASSHEDLAGQVSTEYCASAVSGNGQIEAGCEDDNGHGTHVSGTIAAAANNGVGIVGVAPNARIAACKALNAQNTGSHADFIACILDLVDRAPALGLRVVNMSIIGPQSAALGSAVAHAAANDILIVACGGNAIQDEEAHDDRVSYPGGHPDAIAVAATDRNDERWVSAGPYGLPALPGPDGSLPGSTANDTIDISAPGAAVLSTALLVEAKESTTDSEINTPPLFGLVPLQQGYVALSGTSMASPHVAAAAGLIAWQNPGISVAELRARLLGAVDDLGAPGWDPVFGWGRLNLDRAV